MSAPRPSIVILAGPNGAGKSTVAPALLHDALGVDEFVNADVIARGLSAFDPDRVAIAAGRIMLARLHELAAQRADFAFETTLASRSFAPWLRGLRMSGYDLHLFFLWLSSADLAIARVADRVGMGGHFVPDEVVRRRYLAGIRNFFDLYRPLATTWALYNTSGLEPVRVADGLASETIGVYDKGTWETISQQGKA
jgi:predicted ABC-type ATPase